MKLTDILLTEKAPIVFPHSSDGSRVAKFTVIGRAGIIQFMAASSEDLDKLEGTDEQVILNAILKYANSQYREISFLPFNNYEGAGYAIRINIEEVIKRLSK